MPPRSAFTGSFSASDANNEVVCPLRNHDGSNCRKRCLGEKRYRSMQEHIRRAHPEHYIPKLPATEESFQRMINTPPSERPQPAPPVQTFGNAVHGHERDSFTSARRSPAPPRTLEDQYPAAATAAVALAQLHNHRPDSDWESDQDYASDLDRRRPRMHPSVELPPIQNAPNPQQQQLPPFHSPRPRELLPSVLAHTPPDRATTLPPIQRRESWHKKDKNRPRKSSITQNHRRPKHEKSRSKEFSRRLSIEGRKALSAEPPGLSAAAMGKRWEDLVEAAASATEADSDRDLTPVPQSPSSVKRSSLPPFPSSVPRENTSYKASPLAHTLTPPRGSSLSGPTPFPPTDPSHSHTSNHMSIDSTHSHSTQSSGGGTGHNFHIPSSGLSSSDGAASTTSPTFYTPSVHHNRPPTASHHHHQPNHYPHPPPLGSDARMSSSAPTSSVLNIPPGAGTNVQIYCSNCRRAHYLRECYACTECISGFCSDCVYMLTSAQMSGVGDISGAGLGERGGSGRHTPRPCPRCGFEGGRYKPFRLDFR